jgi:hypothetical protein
MSAMRDGTGKLANLGTFFDEGGLIFSAQPATGTVPMQVPILAEGPIISDAQSVLSLGRARDAP